MPAVFIGHGSPMNTLEHNRHTQAWYDFGRSLPTPRAILAISAHWYTEGTAVTAMARPRTIHDFSGFPAELFAFQYPAAGDPQLAAEVAELVRPTRVLKDASQWGLDHGTWSILAHMFPKADVPVVQLSIDARMTFAQHLQLGAALAPLREQGVLIFGSGNIVHNLRQIAWDRPDGAYDWNDEFDRATREVMAERPADLPSLQQHRHFLKAAPSPDHFIPALHIAGLAAAAGTAPEVLVDGCAYGSLSMTSYVLRAA
jgi:4,5-DOPA dioxygenase extradiol